MNPTFSIIIPVYNVAPYLRECLDSVLAQTCPDWEAICVDDGSTDASGAILDEYAARDARFRVIHQPNAGVSAARNRALENAQGEWIVFLDSDDVLYKHTLEVVGLAIDDKDDFSFVHYRSVDFVEQATFESLDFVSILKTKETINVSRHLDADAFMWGFWTNAYKKEVLKNLRFPDLSIGEDRVFYYSVLERSRFVCVLDIPLYGYRIRKGSAVHSCKTDVAVRDDARHYKLTVDFLMCHKEMVDPAVLGIYSKHVTESIADAYFAIKSHGDDMAWNEIRKLLRDIIANRHFPAYARFAAWAVTRSHSKLVYWVLCYVPYYLKSKGLNRRFVRAKKCF